LKASSKPEKAPTQQLYATVIAINLSGSSELS